ncbi:DUF6171 family protein [Eubacterium xylanophilum]|uniref:DUF6171 family protein n=1 Tax=Eubacterium xylanophilum TaxID=39497 RepID=UPI00047D30BE|nr:DUF6171 family protein [Eubacterium xylanophilum]MCR5797988.1 DUF6171 family protein [Eubacterium sp.]
MSRPFCKKCMWTKEMLEKERIKVEEYVSRIPVEERVCDSEYERRLLICGKCSDRRAGFCGQCGCYIEIRAARKTGYCPGITDKWKE